MSSTSRPPELVRVFTDGQGKPVSQVAAVRATTNSTPNPLLEVLTMKVPKAQLAVHLGLPANADESLINARLRGVQTEREVKAGRPAPRAPRLEQATIQAKSDAELQSLAASSHGPDWDAVQEELGHRAFMAGCFPAAGKTMTSARARIRHYG